MLLLALATVAFAQGASVATPSMTVSWRLQTARVHVQPPKGHHLAPDAPLRAELVVGALPWSVDTLGIAAAGGLAVPLPPVRPLPISGTLEVSICDDAGSRCDVVRQAVQMVLDTPKGRGLAVDIVADGAATPPAPASLSAALEDAGEDLVLIDFGAVWCPPCNLLSTEVLHDPDDAALLDGIVLYEVDVDTPTSWPTKDRYAVGSYPTLVAVDAQGDEVDRLVGYPGESAVHSWLGDLRTVVPLADAPAAEDIPPSEAASWARRFVEGQREEDAPPYLARASTSEVPLLDAQIATYLLRPTPALARTLAEADVAVEVWGWAALSFTERDPELAAFQREAVRAALPDASAVQAAELFYMLGKLSSEANAPDRYLLGALSLTAALSGNLDQDRGHLSFLAQLWENAEDVKRAIQILDEAVAYWPDDMTFHEQRGRLALRQDDVAVAILEAQAAVKTGHGDNKLRATELLAEALHAAGRTPEAIALVHETLAAAPRPSDDLDVRTPRYLRALQELPFMPSTAAPSTPPD